MYIIPAVILSTALLLAMVLNLALKPAFSAKLTTTCMLIAVVGGLIYYSTGFAETTGDLMLSLIRTPLSVIRMFVGVNELSAISGSTLVSRPIGLVCFWLLHLLAFYSMASAAMITLGAEALRHLRLLLSRRGALTIIYGINDNSIDLGKECLAARDGSVVFVAENASASVVSDLNNLGMSVFIGQDAANSGDKTMRSLRVGKRKISVYALDEAEDKNLFYALGLKKALEKQGVSPQDTRLTLPGEEEILAPMLQVSPEEYGFGYVNVYDFGDLSARAMIRLCPPWESVSFGEDGRAREDYECAVVGFERFGQAALRQLVMNGQFAGASFRATVFSPQVENEAGYLLTDSAELLKQYEIRCVAAEGRSRQFYDFVHSRLKTLKLIAVCTGSEEMDREVSDNLMLFLKRHQAEQICVVRCGRAGVRYQETVGSPIVSIPACSLAMLSSEKVDRAAILLNGIYDDSDRSDWDKWVACDPFGKMSSRASAGFAPAFLRISGSSREEVLSGEWKPDAAMLDVLGETEHKRWNAFHFAMGYRPMSREEFEENADRYRQSVAEGRTGDPRIGKNRLARTHACLIPWEGLDELSAREAAITGRQVDYKQADINNVLALPLLLREQEGEGEKQ